MCNYQQSRLDPVEAGGGQGRLALWTSAFDGGGGVCLGQSHFKWETGVWFVG